MAKNRKNNPTQKDTKMSIQASYEAATNNYTNYSTNELGRLEAAEDIDLNNDLNTKNEKHRTIGKKKINQPKK